MPTGYIPLDPPARPVHTSGMFVRHKKSGDRIRVQVVRSVRDGDRVRQRVVRHVGTATSDGQLSQLDRLGRLIIEEMRQAETAQLHLLTPKQYSDLIAQARLAVADPRPFGVDLAECREEARISVGLREALGEVYGRLGWDRVLGARRMSSNRILKEMVLARVAQPLSKRATVRELDRHGDLSLNLDQVYRTMDFLDDGLIDAIRGQSHAAARKLYDEPVSVIFFDTTTLYFESEVEDGLRAKGYSKDGKHHRVQVVFALLVTPDGIPLGYELFPGSSYEGHTLISSLAGLAERYPAARFTVVADAGMISADNERLLQERGIPYILGARLRSQTAEFRNRALEPDGFVAWRPMKEFPTSIARYKSLRKGSTRVIVTWSPKRARKDARQRAQGLERLRRRLAGSDRPASVAGRGYARFLAFPEGRIEIDGDKVAEAARWDGIGGIVAWGHDDADARFLVMQYRRLWEIEACFRVNKHDLRIRPVFHWVKRRVRAHIAICYMAFCCLQHLRHRLALSGHPMSPDVIRRELNALQISVLHRKGTEQKYAMPSRASAKARRIYRSLGLGWNEAPFRLQPTRKTAARRAGG